MNPEQIINNREQVVRAIISELQKCESVLKLGFNLPETTIVRLIEIKNQFSNENEVRRYLSET